MLSLPWLEDFNERPPDPEPAEPAPPEEACLPDPRIEAWNEGFLAGWRQASADAASGQPSLAAELIRRIEALQAELEEIAARSAAQMGGLLVDMLARAVPEDWPQPVADRLQRVIEAVRPAFHLDPRFALHADPPILLALQELPALARYADETQATAFPVTLVWEPRAGAPELAAALRQALTGA